MPETPSHEALQRKIEKPELKKAQLETENRQYREFIENLEEVFYSLDQDGAGSYISPNIDGFVKSPISSLRCIPSEFHVLYVRCIPRYLRRLDLELFTLPSQTDFLRKYQL